MARVLHNKETPDIEKRVAEIESRLRRMQRTSLIKNIIYVIIVIGVALYVYKLYTTSHGWRAELVDVPRIGLASPTQLRISFLVKNLQPLRGASPRPASLLQSVHTGLLCW